jgi:hypothetical protein
MFWGRHQISDMMFVLHLRAIRPIMAWTGIKLVTPGGDIWTRWWTLLLYKRQRISWSAVQLSTLKLVPSSWRQFVMKLVALSPCEINTCLAAVITTGCTTNLYTFLKIFLCYSIGLRVSFLQQIVFELWGHVIDSNVFEHLQLPSSG